VSAVTSEWEGGAGSCYWQHCEVWVLGKLCKQASFHTVLKSIKGRIKLVLEWCK